MVYSDFVARVLLVHDPLLPWTSDRQITVGIESRGHLASFVLGVIWEGGPPSLSGFTIC